MFAIKDKPGALYEALIVFHSRNISLTRIKADQIVVSLGISLLH